MSKFPKPSPLRPAKPSAISRPSVSEGLTKAASKARRRGSSALYLIACIFLATAVLRANFIRHDLADIIASPANAAESDAKSMDKPSEKANMGMDAGTSGADKKRMSDPTMADSKMGDPKKKDQGGKGMADASGGMMDKKKGKKGHDTTKSMMEKDGRCLDGAFLAAVLEREKELDAMAPKC